MKEVDFYTLKHQKVRATTYVEMARMKNMPVPENLHMAEDYRLLFAEEMEVHHTPIRVFRRGFDDAPVYYSFGKDVEELFDFEVKNYEELERYKKEYKNSLECLDKANERIKIYEQMSWKDHLVQSWKLFWSK